MSTVSQPSYRKRIGYQAGLLGGFSTMAAVLLVVGHSLTRDDIALRQQEDLMASLSQVVPHTLYDNDIAAAPMQLKDAQGREWEVYRATRAGQVTAVAYEVTGYGYAGAIEVLMGLDTKGEILGVRILSHAETPGLGDKIETAKSDWVLSFDGLSFLNTREEEWAVKKDGGRFDQFSGATITPRAVVTAVKEGMDFFEQYKGQLITAETQVAEKNEQENAK